MKFPFLVTLMLCWFACLSQNPAGIFDNHADIGKPKKAGSSQYDQATQTYTITGAGYNIWFNRDEFRFLYKKINGDFILTADFAFPEEGGDPHRKIGWMVRESLDEQAANVNACAHGDGLIVLQWRLYRGMFMRDPQDEIFFPKKKFQTIQLERTGKKFTMRVANPGEPLQVVGWHEMPDLRDSVYAGLYICSHDTNRVENARIWNVRIDIPVANAYSPNPQVRTSRVEAVLGSQLEIMNVFDGMRTVIHESTAKFEAPNWMPDGKRILYNDGGSLYTISIEGGQPEKLNTGFANRNNNDHVISFDGKMVAISHHRDGLPGGGSTIYYLPITGGDPKLVTDSTPSYLHGWNPNNKEVVYVAQRLSKSPVYNLYKKNINGGPEVQLTFNTKSHVDGPEYSPDGKYIYYNASETGTMQLWRMKPDGSAKEQITFDEYNNWFPHVSPDGKWIAFMSFISPVAPDDHPLYKKVMLRLMPVNGGSPKVIAYLFGGQGTINTPSWSPDSKRIAFVSNSKPLE